MKPDTVNVPREAWGEYKRSQIAHLRPYIVGETLSERVSISMADLEAGSPKDGDMIARNPANHDDQWLVAADYFAANFEPALLAAAPKAEPVQSLVGFDVDAYVDGYELRSDEGDYTPNEKERLLITDAIHGVISELCIAQPEAPKMEQEPVAWRYRSAERPHLGWTKPEYSRRSPYGRIGMDEQTLFTHPAPAGVELLDALKPFVEKAGHFDSDHADDYCPDWSPFIPASAYRRAAEAYAKHKGPQS